MRYSISEIGWSIYKVFEHHKGVECGEFIEKVRKYLEIYNRREDWIDIIFKGTDVKSVVRCIRWDFGIYGIVRGDIYSCYGMTLDRKLLVMLPTGKQKLIPKKYFEMKERYDVK